MATGFCWWCKRDVDETDSNEVELTWERRKFSVSVCVECLPDGALPHRDERDANELEAELQERSWQRRREENPR